MPQTDDATLTEQQRKWFASIREGLQRDTGKTLADWIKIAKTCPETAPRARLAWFKQTHGLMQNRASYVLREAFPEPAGWVTPDALRKTLWTDPASLTILHAVERQIQSLPETIAGQRKTFTAWSRRYQFAALRPAKNGTARLGLALPAAHHPSLELARNESWSERLTASRIFTMPEETGDLSGLLKAAWEKS